MGRPSSTLYVAIREAPAHGARSALCEQIDEAYRSLGRAHPGDTDIHGARKAIKRSRATLRLVRDALPARMYRRENSTLQDAGRPLSAVRDARVLIEALDELVARQNLEPKESASFREALRQEQRHLRRQLTHDDRAFTRIRSSLRQARDRAASAELDSRGWADLGDGLQRIYAHGRKALRAAHDECTPECLHEWRKQSKYFLYQLQLLEPLAKKPIGKLAERAHRLSDRLGDDHDLTVLRQKAVAHKSTFRARGELEALIDAIEQRQSRLRKKAFKIGAKLYEAKPAHLRKRFDRYWKRAPEP